MDKYFDLINLKIAVLRNISIGDEESSEWSDLDYIIPGIQIYEYGGGLSSYSHRELPDVKDIDLVCFYTAERRTGQSTLSFIENEMRFLKKSGLTQNTPIILHYQESLKPDIGQYTFAHEMTFKPSVRKSIRTIELADELLIVLKNVLRRGMGVFISYSWADREFARRLSIDLTNNGIRTWFDQLEIKIGDSLIQKIREGIDNVDYVAVVLSNASINSTWVQKEVDIAMNQEIEGKRVKVLPLLLEDIELPWFLKGKLFADFRDKSQYKKSLRLILDRIDK